MMISSTIAHYLDHCRKMYFETSLKRFTIESVIQWVYTPFVIDCGRHTCDLLIHLFVMTAVGTVNNVNCYLISQIMLLS